MYRSLAALVSSWKPNSAAAAADGGAADGGATDGGASAASGAGAAIDGAVTGDGAVRWRQKEPD